MKTLVTSLCHAERSEASRWNLHSVQVKPARSAGSTLTSPAWLACESRAWILRFLLRQGCGGRTAKNDSRGEAGA